MKDHLSKEPIHEQDVLMVADGAYGSELNVAEAAKHGIRLITTNFTGVKPADIFAEFMKRAGLPFWDDERFINERVNRIRYQYPPMEFGREMFIEALTKYAQK